MILGHRKIAKLMPKEEFSLILRLNAWKSRLPKKALHENEWLFWFEEW